MQVFVYGTLMRGQRNHSLLKKAGAEFVAEHITDTTFQMYNNGSFPVVVPEGHVAITGEIWQVGHETLQALDALEEVDDRTGKPTHIERMEIDTPHGNAWIYIRPSAPSNDEAKSMLHGDWRKR